MRTDGRVTLGALFALSGHLKLDRVVVQDFVADAIEYQGAIRAQQPSLSTCDCKLSIANTTFTNIRIRARIVVASLFVAMSDTTDLEAQGLRVTDISINASHTVMGWGHLCLQGFHRGLTIHQYSGVRRRKCFCWCAQSPKILHA